MQRVLDCVEGLALIAVAAVCIAFAYAGVRVAQLAESINRELVPISSKVQVDLDEAHRVTLEAGLTAMEARKASAEEREQLPIITAKAEQSFESLNDLLTSIRNTSDGVGESQRQVAAGTVSAISAIQSTVSQATPTLQALTADAVELQRTTEHLDTLIADPQNEQTIANLQAGTKSAAAAAEEGREWFHHLLHPTWPERIYHVSIDALHAMF